MCNRRLVNHFDSRARIRCKRHESMVVSMVQAGSGDGVIVWGIYSCRTSGFLVPIKDYLNAAAYLGIVADHVSNFMTTLYPLSGGPFQGDTVPCHNTKIVADWFIEHGDEFFVLKWPPQSSDLDPIEHFWNVVKRNIRILDVLPTNLELWDA